MLISWPMSPSRMAPSWTRVKVHQDLALEECRNVLVDAILCRCLQQRGFHERIRPPRPDRKCQSRPDGGYFRQPESALYARGIYRLLEAAQCSRCHIRNVLCGHQSGRNRRICGDRRKYVCFGRHAATSRSKPISPTNGAGTVTYNWVRSDGATDTATHPDLVFDAQERNLSRPAGQRPLLATNGWTSTSTSPTTSNLGGQVSVVHSIFLQSDAKITFEPKSCYFRAIRNEQVQRFMQGAVICDTPGQFSTGRF
jgi:hypothetical protein